MHMNESSHAFFSGDKNKVQKLVQMAWTFVNDRLDCNSLIQSFPTIVLYQNVNICLSP